jgi:hypothetical protein
MRNRMRYILTREEILELLIIEKNKMMVLKENGLKLKTTDDIENTISWHVNRIDAMQRLQHSIQKMINILVDIHDYESVYTYKQLLVDIREREDFFRKSEYIFSYMLDNYLYIPTEQRNPEIQQHMINDIENSIKSVLMNY